MPNELDIKCTRLLTQIMTHKLKTEVCILISLKYFTVYIYDFISILQNTVDQGSSGFKRINERLYKPFAVLCINVLSPEAK